MWNIIEEPADMGIVCDWLKETGANEEIIKRLEYLIKEERWPQYEDVTEDLEYWPHLKNGYNFRLVECWHELKHTLRLPLPKHLKEDNLQQTNKRLIYTKTLPEPWQVIAMVCTQELPKAI